MRVSLVVIVIVLLQVSTVMRPGGAEAAPGAALICPTGQQRVFRFRFVPLTEHFFIAGRRADGGAWSWGFNYPATWRVTTSPPNWTGWDPRFGSAELIVTPDRQGITHGYRLIPRMQNGVVSAESAISWYIQRFQGFRVRGRMDVPRAAIPGYQAATVTLFYQARYRGRAVEGILSTETSSFYDPMLGGADYRGV
ncbi:MAG: hypothetical protein QN152_00025 [Armatimonadota bacterium]|nr:hypothetical protein [Armatimonadota bacterium]MDR7465392.1 hypothetical protein [Armatimonadota bacterium]MDR7471104.1 hypothetical protein [Armatimonadota bacterium]MDR7475716.1 hypothetical protein [Armatimonadota bacterium]MDR7537903.1 hypothetical protein [Armatimonadota bacterium]